MKKIVWKAFFIWDFDREERWLNEMAAKGFALMDVGYCRYTFEPCEPGEYTIRLEILENIAAHPESEAHVQFIESTGAQCVGSIFRWVYFRKKKTMGAFDLYSDYACRQQQLNRVLLLIGVISPLMLINAINLSFVFHQELPVAFHAIGGTLFFALFVWSIYGFVRISRMKRRLKREHQLFES